MAKRRVILTTCKQHPYYQIKREPRSDCPFCWKLWEIKNSHKPSKEKP